jgi:cytoskeletal protein RodZ
MNDEIFRRIFGLLAFLGIVGLWTLLWYLVGFYNAEQLNRRESKKNTDYLQD